MPHLLPTVTSTPRTRRMNSMARVYPTLCLVLALIAATAAGYAWYLHGQLAAAETRPLAVTPVKASTNRPPVAVSNADSAGPALIASLTANAAPAPVATAPAADRESFNRGEQFARMMETPEVQRLMALQRRSGLDGRFAALFRQLNLSPENLEKFKDLLVEKQQAAGDVFAAARAQGMAGRDNRDQLRQLVAQSEGEADSAIRNQLGDYVYQQYKQYEQTLPQRNVTSQLEQRLSYTATPLTTDQTERLVTLLASAAPAAGTSQSSVLPGPLVIPGPAGATVQMFNGRAVPITDAVLTASQAFLAPSQVSALRSIQQEHAAQAQLRQQMSQARRGNSGGP